MEKLKDFFDDFAFHARVMPIIVLLMPIIIIGIHSGIVQDSWLEGVVLSSISLVFLTILNSALITMASE